MSPTPIDWSDEPERMENVRLHRGCPHGRLEFCAACDQLEHEAQAVWEDEGGPVIDNDEVPEGGEFIE